MVRHVATQRYLSIVKCIILYGIRKFYKTHCYINKDIDLHIFLWMYSHGQQRKVVSWYFLNFTLYTYQLAQRAIESKFLEPNIKFTDRIKVYFFLFLVLVIVVVPNQKFMIVLVCFCKDRHSLYVSSSSFEIFVYL